MTKSCNKTKRFSFSGVFFGLAVVTIGVLWLLSQLGYVLLAPLWNYWPALLIVVGLCNLFERGAGLPHRVWGLSLIGFGTAVQLHYLGWVALSWGYLWPALVIAGGIWILVSALFYRSRMQKRLSRFQAELPEDVVVFGGRDVRVCNPEWTGGEITAIFGGANIDLRDADMAGDEAELRTTAIFGGVDLRVPDHWVVEVKGSPILGAIEDKTRPARADCAAPKKKLILSGAAIFGGVEVKN